MQVEQALFTSAQTRLTRGYHLVARSPGIDDNLAQELVRWSPTHAGLCRDDQNASSLNFFPVSEEWLVLSRSVHGGPEYSGRGGFQTVTSIVALRSSQLAGYGDNPMLLASVLLARGFLRLPLPIPETLRPLQIPEGTMLRQSRRVSGDARARSMARAVLDHLRRSERVAVVGASNPLGILQEALRDLPLSERKQMSFATGIKPSVSRPFRIHFLDAIDPQQQRQLASLGVSCCRV